MMSGWGSNGDNIGTREADESEELAFDESEESLPWLESDEEVETVGFDPSRLVGIGLLMVAALVVLVGGIWWISNQATQSGPEPDGSLIVAPEEPYKTRPENEGGKTFEGTGDASFAVGEGQVREGRLAEPSERTAPTTSANADSANGSGDSATEQGAASETPAETSSDAALPVGTAVQVGAFPSREAAEAGWRTLIRQTEALSGVRYRIIRAQADIGIVYRLQAAAGDNAAANRLCAALKADGLPCLVK